MNKPNVAIIGVTGLIGDQLLKLILKDNRFDEIRLITRKSVEVNKDRVKNIVIDFSDKNAYKDALKNCQMVFCSVGTTIKKVKGDLKAYRKVDFDIPVHAAQFCEENGGSHFSLVSSVGADSNSKSFYLTLKGEVEDSVSKRKIPSISIFRPSLLMGERKEFRLAERISQILMKPLTFLIPSIYKPIEAEQVANSMIQAAIIKKEGVHIYHYREMIL